MVNKKEEKGKEKISCGRPSAKEASRSILFIYNEHQVDSFTLTEADSNYKHRLLKFPAPCGRKQASFFSKHCHLFIELLGSWFHLKRCKHTSATPEDNVNLVKLNPNSHYTKLCKYPSRNL